MIPPKYPYPSLGGFLGFLAIVGLLIYVHNRYLHKKSPNVQRIPVRVLPSEPRHGTAVMQEHGSDYGL